MSALKIRNVFVCALILSVSSAAHANDSLAVIEKFGRVMENEKRNPTKLPSLNDLFAAYSLLSYASKFDAHVRCVTLAHLGAAGNLVPKVDADRVTHAHVEALVYGVKTPEDEQKFEKYEKAVLSAAMIYEAAGTKRAIDGEFPSCLKYVDSIPST